MPNPYNFAPDLSPLLRGLQGYQQRTRQAEQDQLRAQQFQQQQAAAEQQGQLRGLQIQQAEQGLASGAAQQQKTTADLEREQAYFDRVADTDFSNTADVNAINQEFPRFFDKTKQFGKEQRLLIESGAADISGKIYQAIDRGDFETAEALAMTPEIQPLINSTGDPNYTAQNFVQELREDPEGAKELALDTYRFARGDLTRLGIKDPAKVGKSSAVSDYEYYKELQKTDKAGAAEFGRKAGFISREGEKLPDFFARKLSGANEAAFESEESAAKIEKLSGEFKQVTIQGGLTQKWKESYNQSVGTPDAVSNLKIRFHGIKSSNLKQYLPPGSATEFEVKNALRAFPPDSATSEQLSVFLDAMAKAERARGKFESFKADFISKNKSERTKDGKSMYSEWKRTLKEDEAAQKSAAIDKEVEQAETVTQPPAGTAPPPPPPDQSSEQQAIINNLIQSLQPQPQQQPVLSPQEQAYQAAYGRRGG